MPLVANEPARSGLVLVATSWIYAAVAVIPRRRRVRLLVGAAGALVGGIGIAVAAPSLTGSVIAVGSLTVMLEMYAAFMRNPSIAGLGWVTGLPFTLLLAHRLGVEIRDLHFVVFGIGVALTASLSSAVTVRRAKPGSPWIWPPGLPSEIMATTP